MKILQVNNVYAEKSTGKLTAQLHHGLLAAGEESLVVYGRGRGAKEPGVIRLCPDWYGKANSLLSRLTGMPYGGCFLSTERLLGIIRREKPDLVHLQCVNGNFVNIYRLVGWLNRHRVPAVVSLHAEFMYTANCGHAFGCEQWKQGCTRCPDRKRANKSLFFDRTAASWQRMRRAFAGFENCIITPVSPWTQSRGEQSEILKGFRFRTVLNAVDTRQFYLPEGRQPAQSPTVLHVTAGFSTAPGHNKGGRFLAELARRLPHVTFLVAGNVEQGENLPGNLKLLGTVADQQALAELYRDARLTVLVSQKETFSMPCAESLCCGTPVVGFRAGAPEQIALERYSRFVEYGDLEALQEQVEAWLEQDFDRQRIAREAGAAYSVDTMVQRFSEVYEECLHSRKN